MAERVKINEQEYLLPTSISDINLGTFIEWTKIEAEQMPDELRTIVEEKDDELKQLKARRLPKRVYIRKLVPYYARIVSLVSGIPVNILLGDKQHQGCPIVILENWYWRTVNALAGFQYDPDRREFVIDGQLWTLPEPNMMRSTFGEFAEAAQYEEYAADVAAGNWDKMPYVMAVLVKPQGEVYDPYKFDDDSFIEARAETMRRQPMDLVYQVSFFLLERNENLRADSLIYMLARLLATSKRA